MIKRTVVFLIYPNKKQEETLTKTIELYSKAFKECIDVAWEMKNISAIEVHEKTYRKLKAKLGLKSQYLCSARNRAIDRTSSNR